ncbi:MAG: hypothetical protein HWN65_14300 [Candidatus Helarchaeota archaeon]|nr:hypothetical protein [Candidatus Helarchaeota archaeon]
MSSVEYEKEFNLTAQQAYEQTVLWLTAIKAPIKDTNKLVYELEFRIKSGFTLLKNVITLMKFASPFPITFLLIIP